jgi:hypothetical protein
MGGNLFVPTQDIFERMVARGIREDHPTWMPEDCGNPFIHKRLHQDL